MRINDQTATQLKELGVELRRGVSLAEQTSLGIGGTTDELLLHRYETIPEVMSLLASASIPHRFLGGGTNVLIGDGELPWVVLHLPTARPGMHIEGNTAYVDASADLGALVTFCAKHDLGGMEGLIGVPGSVGGALRMNAGAYGTQIGPHVREVEL
ncbi:MAG TPA: FAD-binding protein, partial [Candidatus Polarisedimenticolia bacterium]|nr:FAD-binding protein [Candidatus Polarisedimenticolia bacterium]